MLTAGLHAGTSGETLLLPTLTAPYASQVATAQSNGGGHVLGRYEWTLGNGAPASLQAYISREGPHP